MNFYVIDKEGLATLCADKQDAETTAKEADLLWPKNAPHKVAKIVQEQSPPMQEPVAHCEQGPNFCKQCANQQAEWCAAILYRDHNENPWVHVIQKDLPSGTKLIAFGITKG
jgi:hypothetical protein